MSEFIDGPLAKYYDAAQQEALAREEHVPLRQLEFMISYLQNQSNFSEMLHNYGDVAVIAEHKRKSPSKGEIRPGSSVAWTVEQYQKGGAMALSILTQETHFGGRLEDLNEAYKASGLPILRKDFICCNYQLYEARANGASAVLLIVAGLKDAKLQRLYEEAKDIGLDSLVEVHNEEELKRALDVEPETIGINNRDLDTLEEDIETVPRLLDSVPSDINVVAESGYKVKNTEHMRDLRRLGVNGVLIGTAVMLEKDPAAKLHKWINS